MIQGLVLIANNVSSIALVLSCWWLAHSYAAAGYPHGRAIAVLWGVFGMTVVLTAFARNIYLDPNPFLVLGKCVLFVLCLLIARRVTLNRRVVAHAHIIEDRAANTSRDV